MSKMRQIAIEPGLGTSENDRLSKRLNELEGHLQGIEKKLSNDNFVNRAPENVVEYEKKKMQDMTAEYELVKANLDMLL